MSPEPTNTNPQPYAFLSCTSRRAQRPRRRSRRRRRPRSPAGAPAPTLRSAAVLLLERSPPDNLAPALCGWCPRPSAAPCQAPVEVLRQAVAGDGHDLAVPPRGVPDPAHPPFPRRGIGLPDVVDAARGPPVRRGQRDRQRDVLDVAVRPTPRGHTLSDQNSGSPVVHALEILEQTMLVVAGSVHRRQPQDGAG